MKVFCKIRSTIPILLAGALLTMHAPGIVYAAGGEAPAGLTLVQDGTSRYTILTASSPSDATRDAVEELNYWVKRITGVELPVATVEEWDGKQPYILVGPSSLAEKNGWDVKKLAQEEARVFIEEGRIGLIGNDTSPYPDTEWTGTYYAVLEFVQKSFGVRWVWPGELGEIYTPRKTLAVETKSWQWKPEILLKRMLRNGYGKDPSSMGAQMETLGIKAPIAAMEEQSDQQARWLKRERMNNCSNVKFGHAFSNWWDLYSAQHPDWFALPPDGLTQRGGKGVKLNLSSKEVQDQIFNDWYAAWKRDPNANKYLNVAPNDSRGFDTRPETRAWDAPEMAALSDKEIYNGGEAILSDRYVKFWNILARRVREVDPEAMLSSYAYRNYRKPPLGNEPVEQNIVLGYVGAEGFYPDERFIVDEWSTWARKGAKLSWRPNVLHAGHGMPYLFSRQLYEDFKVFKKNNLLGTDFDSLIGNWGAQGPIYYVLAEQHNRPEASYDELIDEYYTAFGPAKDAVKAYFEYFEKLTEKGPGIMREHQLVPHETWGGWWKGFIRLVPLYLTPEVCVEGERLLARAQEKLADADAVYKDRLAMVELSFKHGVVMSEAFRKLRLHEPNAKVNYSTSREILQPLMDFRKKMLADFATPVLRLFNEEHRQFGIWSAFEMQAGQVNEEVRPITAGWSIRVDFENKGLQAGWQNGGDNLGWGPGMVGMPWRKALESQAKNNSRIVWYHAKVELPDLSDVGERIFLRFGSVDSEARIWLNGTLVNERGYPHNGNYESWSEPFEVEVSKVIKPGADNHLVIRVESENLNAGITGGVSLILR